MGIEARPNYCPWCKSTVEDLSEHVNDCEPRKVMLAYMKQLHDEFLSGKRKVEWDV